MHRTPFAGLTAPDPNDPITVDGGTFVTRNPDLIDHFLRIGAVTHRHDGHPAMPNPQAPPSASVQASGGSIGPGASVYLGYTVTDQDGGETVISPVVNVSTPAGYGAPSGVITASADYSAGGLMAGNYYYAKSNIDAGGGETPIGPMVQVTRQPGYASGQILLAGLAADLVPGGPVAWHLWRSQDGQFLTLIASGTSDAFTDAGANCMQGADPTYQPPQIDTTRGANSIACTLPSADVAIQSASAAQINLYLSTDGAFANPSLYSVYPIASAGATILIPNLIVSNGEPPEVSTSIPGAQPIVSSEIGDLQWLPPVHTASALPANPRDGDARLAIDTRTPWFASGGVWGTTADVDPGGGGAGSISQVGTQPPGTGSVSNPGAIIFAPASGTVINVSASGGSAVVTIGASAVQGPPGAPGAAGPPGAGLNAVSPSGASATGVVVPTPSAVNFAGSGAAHVDVAQIGGSAIVTITAIPGVGPAGPAGPAGPPGTGGGGGTGGASALVQPALGPWDDSFPAASALSRYAYSTGSQALLSFNSAGNVTASAAAAHTNVLMEPDNGRFEHAVYDSVQTVKFTVPTTIGGATAMNLAARRRDDNNKITGQTGLSNGTIIIYGWVNGTPTQLATTPASTVTWTAGAVWWLRLKVQGDVIVLELWNQDPDAAAAGSTPTAMITTTISESTSSPQLHETLGNPGGVGLELQSDDNTLQINRYKVRVLSHALPPVAVGGGGGGSAATIVAPSGASATGASAAVGAIDFAGSGSVRVNVTPSSGSAVVTITGIPGVGPAGASGAPGPPGASGAPGPQGSAAVTVAPSGASATGIAVPNPLAVDFAGSGGTQVSVASATGGSALVTITSLPAPPGPAGPAGPAGSSTGLASASANVPPQAYASGTSITGPFSQVTVQGSGAVKVGVASAAAPGGGSAAVIMIDDQSASFRAHASVTLPNLGAGSEGKVAIDTLDEDSRGGWDGPNHRYIVQVPGLYLINTMWSSTTGTSDTNFVDHGPYINGQGTAGYGANQNRLMAAGAAAGVQGPQVITARLAKGDVVEFYGNCTQAGQTGVATLAVTKIAP